ncbi:MAG: contractile injection system protein, VgrG/Pvc8 family, partial [Rhodothermales bacterium]
MFAEATLFLDVTTPLSNNFTLVDLQGEEALSSLFEYTLVLKSPDAEVDPTKIVGKNITVKISMEKGGFRYINGVVSEW